MRPTTESHATPSAAAPLGRARAALLAAIAVALAGCSVPAVDLPRADVPAEWQHAPANDAALGLAPDLSGWWHAFSDAELDRLVDRALAGNLTLQQAALRIEAARALTQQEKAGFRPNLGAHTISEPTPDSSASYFQAGFDAKWELGLFGRSASSARVAAADVGLAESDAQAARVSVVAEVARAYIELRAAEQRLDLYKQLAESAQRKSTLVATRARLRLASAADAASSAAEEANADAAMAEPKLVVDRCRQQLAVLLGVTASSAADLVGAGAPPTLGAFRIAEAPADLLRTRPEIRRAEANVLKSAGELGIAHADLFPRLAIGGQLTYSARVIGHTRLSDADGIASFGPLIDVPIFDWGARRAVVNARDAALKASVLAYREAVLESVAEVETAMAALEHQRERAADLKRAADALARGDDNAATLRRLGLADDVDMAAATSALVQSRIDLAQAEEARSLAFVALYKALGGAPLPPPSEPAS